MNNKTISQQISEKMSSKGTLVHEERKQSAAQILLTEIQNRQAALKPGIWRSKG